MIHMLGAVLVAACCGWTGVLAAGRLRRRAEALEALCTGLEQLERELSLCLPPLPQLMADLAGRAPAPARELFDGCARALEDPDREAFFQTWDRLAQAVPDLTEEDRRALRPLGQVLGRYDAPGQVRAAEETRRRLEELRASAREESSRLGGVYRAMGAAGGGFLAILLL